MNPATVRGRKVWLITGCSGGFGLALAQQVLDHGDYVAMTCRKPAAVAHLSDRFPRAAVFALDLEDGYKIPAVVAAAEAHFGRIDVLVNNAGYALLAAIEEAWEEQYRALFEVDFFAAVALVRSVMPGMRARRRGHIVNISSMGAITGAAGAGFYAAAKAALELLSESLAAESGPLGIKVTVVQPGAHATAARANAVMGAMLPDYALTAGANRAALLASAGGEPGDVELAAAAIMRVVDEADPPLHLPLGIDALHRTRTMIDHREAILDRWQPLICSTWRK